MYCQRFVTGAEVDIASVTAISEVAILSNGHCISHKLKSLAKKGSMIKKNQLSDKIQGFDKSRNVT